MLLHGGVTSIAFVCVCVLSKYLRNMDPTNLMFDGALPSDSGRKAFDFGKKRPGVRVCVCVGGGGVCV